MRRQSLREESHAHRRRGSLYGLVIIQSLLISLIGLTAISVSRTQFRAGQREIERQKADSLAQSAIEQALAVMEDVSTWREEYANNTESAPKDVTPGTVSFKFVDSDGDLADDVNDPVDLYGYGRVGDSVFVYQVRVQPKDLTPYDCLQATLHAGNSITVNGATVTCNQTLSSNNSVSISSSDVYGAVEAVGTIQGSTYHGSTNDAAPTRTMPDSATVVEEYFAVGTAISVDSLVHTSASTRVMEGVVLSPANNPYGATTNANGIYCIDCQGKTIIMRNLRVLGTLVLKDPGFNSRVAGNVHWGPYVSHYPALISDGDLDFQFSSATDLQEQSGQNFNPPGTPYGGQSDNDTSDTYPSLMKGLVYVANSLSISGGVEPVFEGSMVAGNAATISVNVTLSYRSDAFDNPPPGFGTFSGPMQLVPNSWKRVSAQ